MARNFCKSTTRRGAESNADPDCGNKVGDACEPEPLLFAGMNDHLHAAGLFEHLRSEELVASQLGSRTKVVFASSPGYAGMPPTLQFVYAILILIAEGNGLRMLWAAPNHELDQVNLRLP